MSMIRIVILLFLSMAAGCLGPNASAQVLWLKGNDGVDCSVNGCSITEWTDQTSSLDFIASNNPILTTVSSDFNFNPAVSFSGRAHFQGPAGFADFSLGLSVYTVSKWNSLNHWSRIFDFSEGGPGNDNILMGNVVTSNALGYSVFNGSSSGTTNFANVINTGQAQFFATQQGGGASIVEGFKAGLSLGTRGTIAPANVTRVTNYIARSNWGGDGAFNGDIAELIIYNHETSANEHRSIQSYLALKYGLTLDVSVADYTNTSFESVYNIDAIFKNSIAGLGKDTDLDQRISKSDSTAANLTMSTNSDFTTVNSSATRPALLSGQYLVWGHNDGNIGTRQVSELNTGVYAGRISREWKIQDTNDVGLVNLSLTGLPTLGVDEEYRLIYAASSDFTAVTTELSTSSTGSFNDVDFPSGTGYFTIAIRSLDAQLSGQKSVTIYDPLSEGLYYIPGNDVIYTLNITNIGNGPVDDGSVFLVDRLPDAIHFYNGDIDGPDGPETDPVTFTQDGAGLSFNYTSDIAFAGVGGAPSNFTDCTYSSPTSSYEPSIVYICINPRGTMAFGDPDPSFSISFRAQIQ